VIAGIILAAGSSSRLGRPKQLLPLHGEPLIRHTVRRVLASSLDCVLVIVGHEADAVAATLADLPVRIVKNSDAALGQSTSVVAGLEALSEAAAIADSPLSREEWRTTPASPLQSQPEAAIFLLGDQPGVDPSVIDSLIAAWKVSYAPVVAPRYGDGLGNPILFDRRVFPELRALGGDVGARAIVRKYQAAGLLVLVPVASPAPPDVDTEEDYAELLRRLALEGSPSPI
jgi:molybdenum cofactor cytidylyltransferase